MRGACHLSTNSTILHLLCACYTQISAVRDIYFYHKEMEAKARNGNNFGGCTKIWSGGGMGDKKNKIRQNTFKRISITFLN
jgi:hypothetical protein